MEKYAESKTNTCTLIEFQSKYGTEKECEQALFHLKWPEGFQCPKCGSRHYTLIGGRRLPLYQCTECHCQTTSTAGTILANSKLLLVKWFLALYFMASNKDGVSGAALAKYIGVTFKTAWLLLHKIRAAMGSAKISITSADPLKWMRLFSAARRKESVAGAAKTRRRLLLRSNWMATAIPNT